MTPHYIVGSKTGYITNLTVGNDISHDPTFTIVLTEAVPINMTIDAPANASVYYDNNSLTINVTALTTNTLDSAITNDTNWAGVFAPTASNFNLTNTTTLSVGTHCVNVVVNDTVGNSNSSYVCVQINSSVAGGLTNCANLTVPDSSYVMLNDFYTTGTCINISANNVSLNCAGFKIYGDNVGNDYGILVYNWTNQSSIRNCYVQNFTNGIYFERSNWSNVTSSTVYNSSSNGMRPYYSDNILIYNNNISYMRSLATGIYATRATNSNYSYNKLDFDDGGLSMDGGSNYNTIQNNNFSNSPYSGIAILSANSNRFIGNSLYRIVWDAIYPMSSNENIFQDTLIYAEPAFGAHNALSFDKSNGTIFINLTVVDYSVGYRTVATSQNTIFVDSLFDLPSGMMAFALNYSSNAMATNTTFNKSQTAIGASGTNNLTVKWYADVHTIDGVGADVASANVNISNTLNMGTYEFFNDTTNATGWTNTENITEYYQNSSGIYNYTPHKFIGSKTTYLTNTTNYQITSSGHYTLVLQTNVAPAIIQVNPISAQTPSSCGLRMIPNAVFYAYDDNGYLDILNSSAYANFTNGTKTYQTTSCAATYINATTTQFNCTGINFNYTDAPGAWNIVAYATDLSGLTATNNSQSITYNTLVSMTATQLITFGACGPGSVNCVNTNNPAFNLTNCGNVVLNSSITGMNITDGAGHVLAIGNFRVDDDPIPSEGVETGKAEMALTASAQPYNKPIGVSSSWNLWYFLNVPTTQYPTIYNVGYWTWTPSAA
jgi:parallel beta-helix repeat protein